MQKKWKKMGKHAKKTIALFFASLMLLQAMDTPLQVYAMEANKVRLSERYGAFYGKDITNKKQNKMSVDKTKNVLTKDAFSYQTRSEYEGYKELEEERTINSKTYELTPGNYVKEMYFEPIHKEEKGKLEDVDDTLENVSKTKSNPIYENKDGLFDVSIQGNQITLRNEAKQQLDFIHSTANIDSFDVDGNVILYTKAYEHIDMEYVVSNNKMYINYQINGAIDLDRVRYQVKLHGLKPKQEADYIDFLDVNGISVYKIVKPQVSDASNKIGDASFSYTLIDEDTIEVANTFQQEWVNDVARIYPVRMNTRAVDETKEIDIQSSYVRSGTPNNLSSQYDDLFVGYDYDNYGGIGSNIRIARAYLHIANPNLGDNKLVVEANLKLYKEQQDALQWTTISAYKTQGYVNPYGLTWNTQPAEGTWDHLSDSSVAGPKNQYYSFPITSYVEDINKGANKTLLLKASNESPSYTANVFNSESSFPGTRPKVEIRYRDDYDIRPDLDINQVHANMFVFGTPGSGFEALSLNGIAKPDASVSFRLHEKQEGGALAYVSTLPAQRGPDKYFTQPNFITNPIAGTQSYPDDPRSNYTTDYVYAAGIPKFDTFYEYQTKVDKAPESNVDTLYTDGFVKYKVKNGDTLKSISSYYGVDIGLIKADNNLNFNEIREDMILLVRFKKDNPQVSPDAYTPPIRTVEYDAKFVYRGPQCYGNCYVGDPINTSTGNFYHESEDFTLLDYDTISLKRFYNSTGPQLSNMFGNGFTSNLEQYITYDKDQNILFFRGDGKILQIKKDGSEYKVGKEDRIEYRRDGSNYEIKDLETKNTYIFDDFGTLIKIINQQGFETSINYNGYGQIESARMGEKEISFQYNDKKLVRSITLPSGKQVQYAYDNKRNLVSFTDLSGHIETYNYDANHFLVNIIDKNGNKIADNTYDVKGVMQSQKDGNGNQLDFAYDGDKTITTYADGTSFTYAYEHNKVVEVKDGEGKASSYTYDAFGNALTKQDASGEVTSYTYDKFNMTSVAYPDGTSETYEYNANNAMTKHVNREGGVETFAYSGSDMVKNTKPNGEFTSFTYDGGHRVQSETNHFGVTKSYTYAGNQINGITHTNGLVESFAYDANGNITQEADNQGKVSNYIYNDNNQVIQKSHPDGTSEEWSYDGKQNIKQYKDRLGGLTSMTYDKNGNLIKTEKGTLTTSKKYNVFDLVVQETNEQGLTTKYTYDSVGNKLSEKDAYGNEKLFVYDEVGHLIQSEDALGNIEETTYDGDNIVSSVDASGLETTFVYDAYNRQIEKTNPNGTTEVTTYDGLLVKKQVDSFGHESVFDYDAYGREIKVVKTMGDAIITTQKGYDGYGNVVEEIVNGTKTKKAYDVYHREVSSTDALNQVTSKVYDFDGNVVKEVDALGHVAETKYNANGDITQEIDKNGNVATKTYDVNGALLSEQDANGFVTSYTYNHKGQVVQALDPYTNEINYTYDAFGNQIETAIAGVVVEEKGYDAYGRNIEIIDTTSHTRMEYDKLGRVIAETNELTGLKKTTTYDAFGNVIKESDNNGWNQTKVYDKHSREVEAKDSIGRKTLTHYDEAGNVKETKDITGTTKNKYNEENQLVETTSPLGLKTSYAYDGLDRKASEKVAEKHLVYVYDAASQVIEVKDEHRGTSTKTAYDANGNAIQQTDALGNQTQSVYDGKNQVIKTIDARGNETSSHYDANGNVIQSVDALNQVTQTKYNAFGLKEQEVDERGFATNYRYNEELQLIEIEDKLGNTSTLTYNDAKQVIEEVDVNGNKHSFAYDIAGNVIKQLDGKGIKTTKVYDVMGNVVEERVSQKVTKTTYDDKGNVASIQVNDKTTETNTYNGNNQLIQKTDALNYATTYQYDVYGNEVEVNEKGYVTKKVFNAYGEELEVIENGTYKQEHRYDAASRLVEQKTNGRTTLEKTYDENGNVVREVANQLVKETRYDALNREVELLLPAGNTRATMVRVQSIVYDEAGNVIAQEDAYGNKEESTYDANGNIITSTNKLGKTDKFAYDGLGNLTKAENQHGRVVSYVYDANNQVTLKNINGKYASYAYDMYGNLVNEQNEYGYKHNYEYDVYGNQTSYTKPDGTTTGMVYDANNNQIRKGDATFVYNQRGQVIRASNPQGDVTYTYNAFDQMTQVKDTKGNVVSYTYNKDKEISGIVYPNKSVVNYTYNDNNLLASITKNDATIASYTYTARGDVASLTQGNIVSTYAYDDAGRKIAQDTTKGSTPVYQATYGFDANDNLVREVINGKENTYTYNDAQELEESKKYVGDELITTSYTYDLFGNKRVTSSKTGTTTYKYNNKNQLESVEATSGSTSYTYDNNGNLKNKIKADGSNEVYQYDGFDRLIQMKQGAFIYDYRYDAQDERIEQVKTDVRDYPSKAWYDAYYSDYTSKPQKVKRDDMDTTFKLLQEQVDKRKQSGNTCQEASGSSYQLKKQRDTTYKKKPEATSYTVDRNLEYSEVILSNQQESVYSRGHGLLEENKETQVVGLNNTIVATTKGEEVQRVSYTDYGQNDKIAVGHSYNGELQEDTGLIYLRARYYDPEVGSFIQIDNNYAGEQEEVATQNRYAYALNNPYKYIDRDGEKSIKAKEPKKKKKKNKGKANSAIGLALSLIEQQKQKNNAFNAINQNDENMISIWESDPIERFQGQNNETKRQGKNGKLLDCLWILGAAAELDRLSKKAKTNVETFDTPIFGGGTTYDPRPLANGQTLENQAGKLRPAPSVTDEEAWFLSSVITNNRDAIKFANKLFWYIVSAKAFLLGTITSGFTSVIFQVISATGQEKNGEELSEIIQKGITYILLDGYHSTMRVTAYVDSENQVVARSGPTVVTN